MLDKIGVWFNTGQLRIGTAEVSAASYGPIQVELGRASCCHMQVW